MTKKIIYHKKLIRALIVALISLCALLQWQNLNAQNFVGSGGEMVMFSSIHLGTSTNWATNRSAAPGYFSWENGSSTYTGADDAHNIDGYVKKYGIDAFMFPVGTGTDLRTLSISAPTVATDTYGVAWIVGDPTTTGDPTNSNAFHNVSTVNLPIVKVSTSGQWDWQAINGTGDGLTVTVSTPDVSGMATAAELRLVGWDGSKWINLSTAGASANTENGILSGTMVAGIEALGIGHVDLTPPLPPVITTVTTNPNGTLTITGTGEPNTEAKITLPSGEIITTPVGPTGIFGPVTSINPQPTGNISTVIIDPAGNISPPTVTPYVDVTPPIAPTITTVTPNPNGTINVSGTAEPGSTVTVTFPDGSTGTAVTDPSGNYGPVTSITPQPSGLVKAKAVDAAGNISPEVTKPYVDTTPPLPPVITTVTTNPNGTLTIIGIGEPGTEAKITLPSGEIITAPVGPNGVFGPVTSINPQPTGNITTLIIDPAGNISPPTVTPYVSLSKPDLSPGLDIDDLGFTKNPLGEKDFIVDIFEANVGETSAPIVFRITKLPSFDISIPGIIISGTDQSGISGTSSVAGGRPNENGNWLFKQNASSVTISSKPGVKITKAGLASIGFHIKLKTGVATGTKQNINIVIISGTGGGDNNIINDLSSTLISVN